MEVDIPYFVSSSSRKYHTRLESYNVSRPSTKQSTSFKSGIIFDRFVLFCTYVHYIRTYTITRNNEPLFKLVLWFVLGRGSIHILQTFSIPIMNDGDFCTFYLVPGPGWPRTNRRRNFWKKGTSVRKRRRESTVEKGSSLVVGEIYRLAKFLELKIASWLLKNARKENCQ